MHTKFERLLSKSLTTLEVITYYLVVHTGPGVWNDASCEWLEWAICEKPYAGALVIVAIVVLVAAVIVAAGVVFVTEQQQ